MNARILVLATAALMFAAPLSGAAQAGRLTDLAKASLKQNAKLVKKSIKLNAFILKCALNKNGGCGFKDELISRPSASRAPPRACGMSEASRSVTSPPALKDPPLATRGTNPHSSLQPLRASRSFLPVVSVTGRLN